MKHDECCLKSRLTLVTILAFFERSYVAPHSYKVSYPELNWFRIYIREALSPSINGNVEKNFIFVLYRTYLHHSYSTTFSSIICRIKNLVTGIFEKCFLVVYDWDEKKVYNASFKKPRHTEMLKHILQSLDPILEL